MTARDELLHYIDDDDYHQVPRQHLEPLWLQAANERLSEQRHRIPVLGRMADDLGVHEISSFEDLVPLLFAHSNYKSYPDAFVANGQWALMNQWLGTLSARRVDEVDIDGVSDQDEWIQRLHAAGHWVFVTSGTTGKSSFLPATTQDRDLSIAVLDKNMLRAYGAPPQQDRAVFVLGPKYGAHRAALHFRKIAEALGRPDATFYLTEDEMRVSEVSRMADLRSRIAAGTARPSEIADFESEAGDRQADMDARVDFVIDRLFEHRTEPIIVTGFWAQLWTIIERARARGVGPEPFHPDTKISVGGGNKGANLPPDFKEQILDYLGLDSSTIPGAYGMSELSVPLTGVDGRYRSMPWIIPLLLDDAGERLIQQETGTSEGRFAFLDLSIDGRWGGVVTGDRVVMDFSTPTPSVVVDSITRYSAAHGGDDKLTCAGTIDTYVRGVMP